MGQDPLLVRLGRVAGHEHDALARAGRRHAPTSSDATFAADYGAALAIVLPNAVCRIGPRASAAIDANHVVNSKLVIEATGAGPGVVALEARRVDANITKAVDCKELGRLGRIARDELHGGMHIGAIGVDAHARSALGRDGARRADVAACWQEVCAAFQRVLLAPS